jgi:hypothetical protein
MSNLPTEFYWIGENGFHRTRIATTYIGPETKFLERLAKTVPKAFTNLMPGIIVAISEEVVSIAKAITEIRLNTFFRPETDADGKVALVPVWRPEQAAALDVTWKPPGSMQLFFVAAQFNGASQKNKFYIISRYTNRLTYLLPLPNLYDDGRICLPDGPEEEYAGPLSSALDMALKSFQTSQWNIDLHRAQDHADRKMFRFDPDGKQLPIQGSWPGLCEVINNAAYQFLGGLP